MIHKYSVAISEVLQYIEWRNFSKVLDRAKLACEDSREKTENHFVEVNKLQIRKMQREERKSGYCKSDADVSDS